MEFKYISPFQYYKISNPLFANAVNNNEGVTFLQGIKAGDKDGTFIIIIIIIIIIGSINAQDYGLVFDGPIDNFIQPGGSNGSGIWYFYPVPQLFKKEYRANCISI